MPDFVQPPQISNWAIEQCEDICQVIPTFEGLIASINGFLNDWYAWLTSDSFPNVFYVASEDKFYYYDGGFHEFVNFPNVFMENGVLRYRTGAGTSETVPAYAIEGNVFYLEGEENYLRVADGTPQGKAIMPFANCVRYNLAEAVLEYWNGGGGWQDLRIEPNQGALLIQNGEIKWFQGHAYVPVNLPCREGDLKNINGKIYEYKNLQWIPFYQERQIRATADYTGIEVYRNGVWELMHTF